MVDHTYVVIHALDACIHSENKRYIHLKCTEFCFTLLFEKRWYSQSSVFHVKYCHYMSCLLFSYKRSFEMSTSFMFYSQNNIVWCFVQQYISLLSLFFHHYGCRMFLVSTKKLLFTSQWTQLLRYTHGEETSYY